VMVLWFLSLAALGIMHIAEAPMILAALNPLQAVSFIFHHGLVGFLVLGSVFLTVTGAEALFADMGHFGRWPIQASWLFFALPCLALNYFGQGAMALHHLRVTAAAGRPFGDVDWFFTMAPHALRVPMVVLSMLATIIASQAVITGAYSLTQQAMQLGFLPRLNILNTSEKHSGQIFIPAVNSILAVAVVFLVLSFKSSAALGDAYGLAVTGTMVVTTMLGFIVVRRMWKWPLAGAVAMVTPLLALDLTFLAANALKIPTGGWLPLLIAGGLMLIMTTWVRGTRLVTEKMRQQSVPLAEVLPMLSRSATQVPGTAVFMTSDPETAPAALLHNLKHNHVLHQHNLIMTVRTMRKPRVDPERRIEITRLSDSFQLVTVRYGFMERPHIPRALTDARKLGLKTDIMSTSFFLGRRSVVASAGSKLTYWRSRLYIFMTRNSTDPTAYFHIPPGRVVELGSQVTL
jgi:KUP system potassium uptake protein